MSGAGTRSVARDVFFYDIRYPDTTLGGLVLTPGVTNANFHSMIEIVLIMSSDYSVQNDKGKKLPRDSNPFLPGKYSIVASSTVEVNDEHVLIRDHVPYHGNANPGFQRLSP